jgi:hypothetical protein
VLVLGPLLVGVGGVLLADASFPDRTHPGARESWRRAGRTFVTIGVVLFIGRLALLPA